ncbi:uncharacterized protein [Watersipora subatra]|uniref:uncharacterized protein n=1 Tax=Watersipora subatra TaxID=2589382 RepID=UPI00355C9768
MSIKSEDCKWNLRSRIRAKPYSTEASLKGSDRHSERLRKRLRTHSSLAVVSDAVVIAQGYRFDVSKSNLSAYSSVFKNEIGRARTNGFKVKIELGNKKAELVKWMLDYLHHNPSFHLTDEKAEALLPLAIEYKIPMLEEKCVSILIKSATPPLHLLTLAEKHNIESLKIYAVEACSKILTSSISEQLNLPENASLTARSLQKIYE